MKSTTLFAACISTLAAAGFAAFSSSAQQAANGRSNATLDGKAVRTLASDHVWEVKRVAGPGHNYWSWKSDGSVCMRFGEKAGRCTDTGLWKVEGERLCYELTWWGAETQLKSTCFRISDKGKGRYAWLSDKEVDFFEFEVLR